MREKDDARKGDKKETAAVKEAKENQQDILIRLARQAVLFKNEHREPFARLPVKDHWETWPVASRDFKLWLIGQYYDQCGKGPNSEAISSAINTISAQAWRENKVHKMNVRVAEADRFTFYYDLADETWRAVEITPKGWRVINSPPSLFRRYTHMQRQPEPDQSGDARLLLDFINLQRENDQVLLLSSIISSFIPEIAHVVIVFHGPQGAAKTTASKVVRSVIDPSASPTCRNYENSREFVQYLAHNHVVVLDNLSGISHRLSDQLCSAVTGDGDTKRALYSNDDDIIYNFKRCFVINGINNVVLRADLLRRSVLFELKPPLPHQRKEERDFWRAFEQSRPKILGGIFHALSKAMALYPSIQLNGLYSMADFTRWGAAVAEALGYGAGAFLKAYADNIGQQNEEALANHPVAATIKVLVTEKHQWVGSPSELLAALEMVADKERINIRAKGWPKAANSLVRRLNEIKPTLEAAGIGIHQYREGKNGDKLISLQFEENTDRTVRTVDDIAAVHGNRGISGADDGGITMLQSISPSGGIPGQMKTAVASGDTGDTFSDSQEQDIAENLRRGEI